MSSRKSPAVFSMISGETLRSFRAYALIRALSHKVLIKRGIPFDER